MSNPSQQSAGRASSAPGRPPILIRADATRAIGTGHLMRCLALAQTCMSLGSPVVFALADCPTVLADRLTDAGARVSWLQDGGDPTRLAELIDALAPAAVVIDGYQFDAGYRKVVAAAARCPVVAIDDGNLDHPLHADLVVNTSPLATPEHYRRTAPDARLMLGPAYALLRPEFTRTGRPTPTGDAPPHLLVTFGGSDPMQLTLPVVRALLERLTGPEVLDVVVGGAATATEALQALADDHPNHLRLHRNPPDMAALMRCSRLAIAAAGSTLWELAYLAVPTVAVVVADNQDPTLQSPLRDWFASLDARSHCVDTAGAIADAALALWREPAVLAARAAQLRSIDIGGQVDTLCHTIAQSARQTP